MQTEKKLAITVFSFPPDKGNVGTAAYLNVFSSIFSVLERADQNYVRKHALEQAEALGVDIREAATRVFSNASGSYSSNINLAVKNSSWNDEKQLQDMYLSRKPFAFDCDAPGAGMTEKRKVF